MKMKPHISITGLIYDMNWIKRNITISNSGCWNWERSVANTGYGQFGIKKLAKIEVYKVRRYVYRLTKVDIRDPSVLIRHTCHNPRCCNPGHLIHGTAYDNYHDSEKVYEDRNKRIRRENRRALNAQHADKTITIYRKKFIDGTITVSTLARKLVLSRSSVMMFLRGETYRRCPHLKLCRRIYLERSRKFRQAQLR
jgi:hypothetical protein